MCDFLARVTADNAKRGGAKGSGPQFNHLEAFTKDCVKSILLLELSNDKN